MKLGLPADFPDGLKFLPDERLFVFREGKTFHAISAVCTHLGCTVRAEALANAETATVGGSALRLTHRFLCPCHGSKYKGDGTNVAGPGARSRSPGTTSRSSPDDGQLVVDLARRGRARLPPDAWREERMATPSSTARNAEPERSRRAPAAALEPVVRAPTARRATPSSSNFLLHWFPAKV